ncbi:MAG: HlyD family efflux transporter periplasmic adaptor subunit [Chloroflexi bacterium]|nr:HlyD family efflux transporter periplasmic adaptor subunit [Chloroflexota bacterium]
MKFVNLIWATADRRPLTAIQSAVCRLPSAVMLSFLLIVFTACQAAPSIATNGTETFTGFLIGETVEISSEVGGRIANVAAKEGEIVQAGQTLLTLDDEIIKLRIEMADANVAAAQAQVALLEAGTRNEEIRRAEARIAQARAALVTATQALTDTEAIRANPQVLLIARAQAEQRAQAAQEQLIAAAQQAQAADLEHAFWEETVRGMWAGTDMRLPNGAVLHFDTPTQKLDFAQREWTRAGNDAWQAWGAVTQAQANLDGANAALKDVSEQITNSVALDTRVNQARATRDRANAALQAAQAALDVLREGASPAQVQVARAALDQARAARSALDQDLARHTIAAPKAGTVTRVLYRAGEVIAATTPVARLTVAGDLKLRVFVPMSTLAQIKLNQTANIVMPEAKNQTTTGAVTFIADRAEFSGRQSQTDSERNAQLVTVEMTVKDASGQLKAGMPATVAFNGTPSNGIALPSLIARDAPLTFSGTLENKQTRIAPEIVGKVMRVRVQRADTANAGDTLVELDNTTARASVTEAEAVVRTAQANLDQVNEKARPGALALADAAVAQAQAELASAQAASADAERALKNPQELLTQLHTAESRASASQGDITRAEATLASVKSQVEVIQRDQSFSGKTRTAMALKQQLAAEANLRAAKINAQGNARVVELYRSVIANPLELRAAHNAALNQVKQAQAGLDTAQAERAITQRGAQTEQVALADAKVRAAQAGLKLAQAQVKRTILTTPFAGTIVGRSVEVGETVRPGSALLLLADTRELELTIYIPIQTITAVKTGQAARVQTPSLPGKTFAGQVAFIASEGEFKPANIYNSQERSEMVFAVRVAVANPNGELKAGLPADAMLGGR